MGGSQQGDCSQVMDDYEGTILCPECPYGRSSIIHPE